MQTIKIITVNITGFMFIKFLSVHTSRQGVASQLLEPMLKVTSSFKSLVVACSNVDPLIYTTMPLSNLITTLI
jgi:hypothetical protein